MSTKPLFENISDNVVVHALTNWICTGYYLESNFDLRQKNASMERIIDAATNVVNELKQKDSSELIIPYIDGHIRYKHICHTFTRDFLRIIVSKTQYTSFDYPKYGITSYDNSPEIITCPKCREIVEYDGDVYACKKCNTNWVLTDEKCPKCGNCTSVWDLDLKDSIFYCCECYNTWVDLPDFEEIMP